MVENQCPDFSHLPIDALHVVFQHLFTPRPCDELGLPLSTFLYRWEAIRGTCRHWGEVLLAHPPQLYLDISVMPKAWVHWMLSLPMRVLRIEEGLDVRWSPLDGKASEGEQQHGGPPAAMPAPISALQLVAELEGAGRPAPSWSLSLLSRLQCLHLQAAISSPMDPTVFDGAAVRDLKQLTQLSLGSFADFQLEHVPTSLRRLRLCYDEQTCVLSVPHLPDHIISLDLLQLEKPGTLGVCLDDVWGRVAELDIQSQELLLGVPVHDRRLISTFERPYREGSFVPPHIWGDEEADDKSKQAAEMTANHFLACLPSCPRLERLCLADGAAASAKFMPVQPHARDSLKWLWSVVRLQGLHNLYGLSGHEMEKRQQLFGGRLSFKYHVPAAALLRTPELCCICIVQRQELEPVGPTNGGEEEA